MSDFKISVDPIGQLKLFRTSTFADPYVFIAEAMQNAQRAAATEVSMVFDDRKITISDNGKGLSNPESLFTIAKTGWDEETQKNEDPFGIGFFSSLALADTVEIYSGKKSFKFSFPALESGNLGIETTELDEEVVGFTVVLTDLIPEYNLWTAKSRAKDIASTIPTIVTTVNGTEVETFDFTAPPETPHESVKIPHKIKGWIALADYSWKSEVKVYHQGRFVRNLEMDGLIGALEIELTAVHLRAPDRRDFIKDELYEEFMSTLKDKFVKPFLIRMTGSQLKSYQMSTITHYLQPSDYAGHLRYLQLSDNFVLEKVSKLSESDLTDLDAEAVNELFTKFMEEPESVRFEEVDTSKTSSSSFIPESERVTVSSSSVSKGLSIEDQEVSSDDSAGLAGVDYRGLKKIKRVYYAEPVDLKRKRELLAELVASGQTIIVARTNLEVRALKEALSAVYIGTAEIVLEKKLSVSNRESTAKYDRVQALLKVLLASTNELAKLDLSLAPGAIALVTSRVLEGQTLSKEQSYPSFYVSDGVLAIDTTKLKHSRVLGIKDSRADLGELLYLLDNIKELADCLNVSESSLCKAIANLRISWIVTQTKEEVE